MKTSLEFLKIYEKAILDCDKTIEQVLIKYAPPLVLTATEEKLLKVNKKKHSKHSPEFNISRIAFQYFENELFAISGMSHSSILCFLTNTGNDLHKFPSAKSFVACLRLVPNNKISGEKVISSCTPSGKNQNVKVIRQTDNSIGNQKDHELNLFFKRIAFKKGKILAITATARKLAVIIWNMITKSEAYNKDKEKISNEKSKAIKSIIFLE